MPWSPRADTPPDPRVPAWADRPRPPGARWFPVAIAALIQLPGLILAIVDGGGHPLTAAALLLAFLSSALLAVARQQPGVVVVAVALLCAPAIAVTTGPPFAAVPLVFAVVGAVVRGARVWVWWTLAGFAVATPLAAFLL